MHREKLTEAVTANLSDTDKCFAVSRAHQKGMVMNSALTKQEQVRLIVDQPSLLGDPWQSYEAGKAQLMDMDLSPAEYGQAIKRLAETLGI